MSQAANEIRAKELGPYRRLPSPDQIANPVVTESTKIYDRTGTVLLYEISAGQKRTYVNFDQIPQSLKDAIDFIQARYQIPIVIDQKALDDANVDTTSEVKGAFPGIKLRNLFKLLLEQLSAPADLCHRR